MTTQEVKKIAQKYILEHEGIDISNTTQWTNEIFDYNQTVNEQVHIIQKDKERIREWFIPKKKLLKMEND